MQSDPLPPCAIIFDLDGTLYQMRWFFRLYIGILAFPKTTWLSKFMRIRSRLAGVDLGSHAALIAELERRWSIKHPILTGQLNRFVQKKFYPAFVSAMRLHRGSRPGLIPLLKRLRLAGIRIGILSDFGQIPQRLKNLGIDPSLFDSLAASEECGALKPCARPLEVMAAHWGFAPAQVLVIGDRDDTDGEAARRAGMQFVHISDEAGSSVHSRSWKNIRKLLEAF